MAESTRQTTRHSSVQSSANFQLPNEFPENSKLQKKYDTIIIGGGLSGLLTAQHLQQSGQTTLIIEQNDSFGGHLNSGITTLPYTDLSKEQLTNKLNFLAKKMSVLPFWQTTTAPPATFDGELKEFVGFGEQTPESIDQINHYITSSNQFSFSVPPDKWANYILQNYKGDFCLNTFATKISTEKFEKTTRATTVTLNGKKTVQCENIVLSANPKLLNSLLDNDTLSTKTKKSLSKNNLWTSVSLELLHNFKEFNSSVFSDSTHVLMPKKDSSNPVLGLFKNINDTVSSSDWMTFLPSSHAEDHANIADALKRIKKQIKRAYPELFTNIISERITINNDSHGLIDLPITAHQTLREVENIWINSAFVHQENTLIGTFAQTQLVLASMGFACETTPIKEHRERTTSITTINENELVKETIDS